MRRKILVAVVIFVIGVFVIQGTANAFIGIGLAARQIIKTLNDSDKEALKQKVQTIFNDTAAAFDRKDIDSIGANAIPQASIEYKDGTLVSLEEWKANAREQFADMDTMRSEFKVESVKPSGDITTVTYTETHEYTLYSDAGHQYRMAGKWEAMFNTTPEGLRVTHLKELSEETTRDGEPYTQKPLAPKT
ncbi:MAG: hypothetical protein NTV07_07080 [Candidatus Omnitrophica bacterium]|nr:hypothetical protein [Candidatus Omnitrophota bacterium]